MGFFLLLTNKTKYSIVACYSLYQSKNKGVKMLTNILQIWGGIFYLLNKIFFSQAERKSSETAKEKWQIWAWIVYIIGLPGWTTLFIIKHNWIAFSIEAGGLPAMLLGLIIALRGKGQEPKWLDYVTIISIVLGIGFSLYDFGGLTSYTQILELSLTTGFLLGTYLLANKNPKGYLWFMLMNLSCGTLMLFQNYPWLAGQQAISLLFVIDAYYINQRKIKKLLK